MRGSSELLKKRLTNAANIGKPKAISLRRERGIHMEIIQENTGVVYTCVKCSAEIDASNDWYYLHEDAQPYCSDCFTEVFDTCAECGEIYPKDDLFEYEGQPYCEVCYNTTFVMCSYCGEVLPVDDCIGTEEGRYPVVCPDCCDDHFTRCEHCGHLFYNDFLNWDENIALCDPCYHHRYIRCDDCEQFEHIDIAVRTAEGWYCSACAEEHMSNIIRPYHCSPQLQFQCNADEIPSRTTRYFGIELEIESTDGADNDESAAEFFEILNNEPDSHWFACHDGSLNNGFELITQPMTYKYFVEHQAERVQTMMKRAIELGYRGHKTSTCGLHFHVSSASLSEDTIANMILAISEYWPVIVSVSRRSEEKIRQWANRYSLNDANKIEDAKNIAKYKNAGRYLALNVTNRATVELRIFRSTLKYDTFMACWHFFMALIDFCENNTAKQITNTPQKEFIKALANFSPELSAYLTERGLIAYV